jgi:uncharacterized membrane protein HdeD (DUF308 family)
MTMASVVPGPQSLGAGGDVLRAKWRWIVALGVIYILAGFIALSSVVLATIAKVLVVGIMMLVAGVSEVIHAFQVKSWGKFLLWIFLGLLYIVAGVLTLENPLMAAVVLTLVLGATLVASGVTRIVLAFNMKDGAHWTWVVLSGVVTLVLGAVILSGWLISSVYVLGLFLGVDLIIVGMSWVRLGMDLQSRE